MYSMQELVDKVEVEERGRHTYRLSIPGLPASAYWLCEEACRRLRDDVTEPSIETFVGAIIAIIEEREERRASGREWDEALLSRQIINNQSLPEWVSGKDWPGYDEVKRNAKYIVHIAEALSNFDYEFAMAIVQAAEKRGYDWYIADYVSENKWPEELVTLVDKWVNYLCTYYGWAVENERFLRDVRDNIWCKHFRAALARAVIEELERLFDDGENISEVTIRNDSLLLTDAIKEIELTMMGVYGPLAPSLATKIVYIRSTNSFLLEVE